MLLIYLISDLKLKALVYALIYLFNMYSKANNKYLTSYLNFDVFVFGPHHTSMKDNKEGDE